MKAFIDGSSRSLYGYYLNGKTYIIRDSPKTNNQAEWLALHALLLDLPRRSHCVIYSDSLLVVNQFNGKYKVKSLHLKEIFKACKNAVISKELKIDLRWIPREKNVFGKKLDGEISKERIRNWERKSSN